MEGVMLAAIDIHKAVFQAAVLDPVQGEVVEERFSASREALIAWAVKWDGQLAAVGRGGRGGRGGGGGAVSGGRGRGGRSGAKIAQLPRDDGAAIHKTAAMY